VPSDPFGLPTLGASYFIRPLRDDRQTPFEYLRFFQHPDELALAVGGFTAATPNGVVFDPNAHLGATFFPWSSVGFLANVGFSKGSRTALGGEFGGGVAYYPRQNLRLSLQYNGSRNQQFSYGSYGPSEAIQSGTIDSTDALQARARWLLDRHWSLNLNYQSMWYSESQDGSQVFLTPIQQVDVGFTYAFNRWVSLGLDASAFLIPVYAPGELDGPLQFTGRAWMLQGLPHVNWFMNDFLSLSFAVGPRVAWIRAVDPSKNTAIWGGTATLSFNARL
jgi:hypothetical protein